MDPTAASQEMMKKFWGDWFQAIGSMQAQAASTMSSAAERAAGLGTGVLGADGEPPSPPPPSVDAMRGFQDAFLEAFAGYCDEYMRSPQFLAVMKQAMDNALVFRQQVNEFVNRTTTAGFQQSAGYPPDQTVIVDAVRETERKLADRIDDLAGRLGRLETTIGQKATTPKSK